MLQLPPEIICKIFKIKKQNFEYLKEKRYEEFLEKREFLEFNLDFPEKYQDYGAEEFLTDNGCFFALIDDDNKYIITENHLKYNNNEISRTIYNLKLDKYINPDFFEKIEFLEQNLKFQNILFNHTSLFSSNVIIKDYTSIHYYVGNEFITFNYNIGIKSISQYIYYFDTDEYEFY